MDTTDRKIIKYLEENGRATIKEIAQNVNLSSPAVTERIKRLEEQGIRATIHMPELTMWQL
ncbi:MAG: Lrp/AsnC family transcriptional regulator, partial [Clostridia bacterium]